MTLRVKYKDVDSIFKSVFKKDLAPENIDLEIVNPYTDYKKALEYVQFKYKTKQKITFDQFIKRDVKPVAKVNEEKEEEEDLGQFEDEETLEDLFERESDTVDRELFLEQQEQNLKPEVRDSNIDAIIDKSRSEKEEQRKKR